MVQAAALYVTPNAKLESEEQFWPPLKVARCPSSLPGAASLFQYRAARAATSPATCAIITDVLAGC